MMKYIWNQSKKLGFFFQISLRNLNLLPQDVQNTFLASDVSKQIEMGNPDFLCGKSGYELALIAFPKILTDDIIKQAISEPFYPEAEYWSGTVLAYGKRASRFPRFLPNIHLNGFYLITI